MGSCQGAPFSFYILQLKNKTTKKLTDVLNTSYIAVWIQGRGTTSDSKGIRRRRDPRAWASKGVAGLRTRRASKGVGIKGRRRHPRASSASKGHRSLIGVGFSELLRNFCRISRIYTPASSPVGHWCPWRLGKLTVSDTERIVSTI